MESIQEFVASVAAARASLDQILSVEASAYNRTASDEAKMALVEAQTNLQTSFTRLRKVRKELFLLQPGEQVPIS